MLGILKNYNGQILTNELIRSIAGKLIKARLYSPIKIIDSVRVKLVNEEDLLDEEINTILEDNPQNHKEAGFDRGWSSRFDTLFKIGKELGFVYYEMGQPIEFSAIGLKLSDSEHPEFEQQAFLNAFVKYQRNNPFRRVSNENIPLILLLDVIKKINADQDFNNAGITKLEVPLFLTWRDSNAEALYRKIKSIREKFGYEPSWEVILAEVDELTEGRHASMPDKTIMVEYVDEFLRKMRLTGLLTVRGFGRFIDLNKKEIPKIDYILQQYSSYKKYGTEKEYFNYASEIDERLISIERVYESTPVEDKKLLLKWAAHFSWETLKLEILKLSSSNPTSTDQILSLIPAPLRFEFLITLAVVSKFPHAEIRPNYISDDEGLPSTHAPGNGADIECYEAQRCTLIEVTLLNGVAQVQREMAPITRHLQDKRRDWDNAVTFFIAPVIHRDTMLWVDFIKKKDDLDINFFSIPEFLGRLQENRTSLYPPAN